MRGVDIFLLCLWCLVIAFCLGILTEVTLGGPDKLEAGVGRKFSCPKKKYFVSEDGKSVYYARLCTVVEKD